MADRYLLESGSPNGYLMEDGGGVLILEFTVAPTITGGTFTLMGVGCWIAALLLALGVVPCY